MVQTWTQNNGSYLGPGRIVSQVLELDFSRKEKGKRKPGSDHSKWAVSVQRQGYIFIGDLNRYDSQCKRGGGGLLLYALAAWQFLKGVVAEDEKGYFSNQRGRMYPDVFGREA